MDIRCDRSGGALKFNEGTDWLESPGLRDGASQCAAETAASIPDEYQGFAFGFGVDRLGMLKYGMPDLRPMLDSDTRWLSHYGFSDLFGAPSVRAA